MEDDGKLESDKSEETQETNDQESVPEETAEREEADEEAASRPTIPDVQAIILKAARSFFMKVAPLIVAIFLMIYGFNMWFGNWRLEHFRSAVEEAVNEPGGFANLKPIDDWRVDKVNPTTYRVSRNDGKYVVIVWRLGGERYLVESVKGR